MKNIRNLFYLDDDADDLEILQSAVIDVDSSIQVKTESDPYEALNYLGVSTEKPDVILLDINMPKMNGFEFFGVLKMNESLGIIPVIFYSTSNNEKEMSHARKLGAKGYIVKTTSYSNLCETLGFWLGKTNTPGNSVIDF